LSGEGSNKGLSQFMKNRFSTQQPCVCLIVLALHQCLRFKAVVEQL